MMVSDENGGRPDLMDYVFDLNRVTVCG